MFIDENSAIDKEALRQYINNELLRVFKLAEMYVNGEDYQLFWQELHNKIGVLEDKKEKEKLVGVESQLKDLPEFIYKWIESSVESVERFDFFIATKAEDIGSGDQQHDYFWALQIRHDQLVALVKVLDTLMGHMKNWVKMSAGSVLSDGVFLGLTDYSVEDQIYLEAEKIHKQRENLL